MTLEIAIIADDLTGALDTSAPFAMAGRSVVVAPRPAGLESALATGANVVVVNTASRALPAGEAARIVRAVAEGLVAARPALVFKKIDSRLKGNIGAETAAIADAFGFAAIRVAPAVPEQGRVTRRGAVAGRGVDVPIPVAPLFAGLDAAIADANDDADLDRVVTATDWTTTLAVGARGLGAALARRYRPSVPAPMPLDRRTLFVIGSRDRLTAEQVAALGGVAVHDAPQGRVTGNVALPAVLRCTGPDGGADAVASRFAAGAAAIISASRPAVLLMSGGDTALAVLDRLGVDLVRPRGEAAPGLPWFSIARPGLPDLTAVVKSGGFGESRCLAALLPPADA